MRPACRGYPTIRTHHASDEEARKHTQYSHKPGRTNAVQRLPRASERTAKFLVGDPGRIAVRDFSAAERLVAVRGKHLMNLRRVDERETARVAVQRGTTRSVVCKKSRTAPQTRRGVGATMPSPTQAAPLLR